MKMNSNRFHVNDMQSESLSGAKRVYLNSPGHFIWTQFLERMRAEALRCVSKLSHLTCRWRLEIHRSLTRHVCKWNSLQHTQQRKLHRGRRYRSDVLLDQLTLHRCCYYCAYILHIIYLNSFICNLASFPVQFPLGSSFTFPFSLHIMTARHSLLFSCGGSALIKLRMESCVNTAHHVWLAERWCTFLCHI